MCWYVFAAAVPKGSVGRGFLYIGKNDEAYGSCKRGYHQPWLSFAEISFRCCILFPLDVTLCLSSLYGVRTSPEKVTLRLTHPPYPFLEVGDERQQGLVWAVSELGGQTQRIAGLMLCVVLPHTKVDVSAVSHSLETPLISRWKLSRGTHPFIKTKAALIVSRTRLPSRSSSKSDTSALNVDASLPLSYPVLSSQVRSASRCERA